MTTSSRLLEAEGFNTYFFTCEGVAKAVNDVSFFMKRTEKPSKTDLISNNSSSSSAERCITRNPPVSACSISPSASRRCKASRMGVRLARALSELFDSDRHSLMTEVSGNAIAVHKLLTDEIHKDSKARGNGMGIKPAVLRMGQSQRVAGGSLREHDRFIVKFGGDFQKKFSGGTKCMF